MSNTRKSTTKPQAEELDLAISTTDCGARRLSPPRHGLQQGLTILAGADSRARFPHPICAAGPPDPRFPCSSTAAIWSSISSPNRRFLPIQPCFLCSTPFPVAGQKRRELLFPANPGLRPPRDRKTREAWRFIARRRRFLAARRGLFLAQWEWTISAGDVPFWPAGYSLSIIRSCRRQAVAKSRANRPLAGALSHPCRCANFAAKTRK